MIKIHKELPLEYRLHIELKRIFMHKDGHLQMLLVSSIIMATRYPRKQLQKWVHASEVHHPRVFNAWPGNSIALGPVAKKQYDSRRWWRKTAHLIVSREQRGWGKATAFKTWP